MKRNLAGVEESPRETDQLLLSLAESVQWCVKTPPFHASLETLLHAVEDEVVRVDARRIQVVPQRGLEHEGVLGYHVDARSVGVGLLGVGVSLGW